MRDYSQIPMTFKSKQGSLERKKRESESFLQIITLTPHSYLEGMLNLVIGRQEYRRAKHCPIHKLMKIPKQITRTIIK